MLRPILLAMLALLAPASAFAAACDGFETETFIADVPFFYSRMERVAAEGAPVVLRHVDDERIWLELSLVPATTSGVVPRSEFVANMEAALGDQVAQLQAQGLRADSAIFPYDPVTWTVVTGPADGAETNGTTTLRISATCYLQAAWHTVDTPALASRVAEFRSSLEAMRAFGERHMAPVDFADENTAPQGLSAFLVGFLAPLGAAAAVFVVFGNMRVMGRPGRIPRSIAGLAAATGIAGVGSLTPYLSDGIAESIHMASAALLVVAAVSAAVSAVVPRQDIALWGFGLAAVSGIATILCTTFGWSADDTLGLVSGGALLASGVAGLWMWQFEETAKIRRRTIRSA